MSTVVQPKVLPPDLESRWDALRRSEILLPEISDYRDYHGRTTEGISIAREQLGEKALSYDKDSILDFHRTAFGATVTDAGEFRRHMVQVGDVYGADGARVERELDLLDAQHIHMSNAANTPEEKLVAMAFAHARMVHIHPFSDGNGRTARAFMAVEAHQEFGVDSEKMMEVLERDRGDYIEAVSATGGKVVFHNEDIGEEKHGFLARFAQLFDANADLPEVRSRVSREKVGNLGELVTLFAQTIEEVGGPSFDLDTVLDPGGEIYAPFSVRPGLAQDYALPSWEEDWDNSQLNEGAKIPFEYEKRSNSISNITPNRDNIDIDI